MGDPQAQRGVDTTEQGAYGLTQSLPYILKAITDAAPTLAKTQLKAEQDVSPAYNELLTGLYEKFAPRLAKTGADIESAQRKTSADTDVSLLKNQGASVGRTAEGLDREFNPEYYAGREATSKKLGELLSSINLGDANPEAERLVSQEAARSGNLTAPSATNTVSNALSFGNEMQKRRNALGSALNIASGFLPIAKSNTGIGFAGGTIGRTPSGTGTGVFGGVKGDTAGTEAQGLASGVFGSTVSSEQLWNQLNQQRRDAMDRVNEGFSALP